MALPWGPPLTSHSPSSQGARGIFPKQARITTTYRKRVRGPRWSRSAPFGLTCEACPSPPGRSPPVRPASRDRPLPLAAPMAPGRCSPGASSAAWHAPAGSPHTCAHAGAQAQLACPSSVPHSTPQLWLRSVLALASQKSQVLTYLNTGSWGQGTSQARFMPSSTARHLRDPRRLS